MTIDSPSSAVMAASDDDDDDILAHLLESEILSVASDQEEQETARPTKKLRLQDEGTCPLDGGHPGPSRLIETGLLSRIPPELVRRILKFLSSEDLVSCSLVCKSLNLAASDESLWHRLSSFPGCDHGCGPGGHGWRSWW